MTDTNASARCDEGPQNLRPPDPVDIVKAMLTEGRLDDVVALVAKLFADKMAIQRHLNQVLSRRSKSREVVSSDQLRLFLTQLVEAQAAVETQETLSKADEALTDAAKLDEFANATDGEQGKDDKKPNKKKGSARRKFPEMLRRVDNPIPVPPDERPCPKCGEERTCIGHDVTEVLERIPSELIVRRDRREKLACKECDGELCRAPMADKVVAKGRMGVQLVSCILVEKYRDGLPLHRQIERFRRLGVEIPISTLVDQVKHAANAMEILRQAAIEEALDAYVMHLDGTGLPVLDREGRKGRRLGTLWAYVGDGKVAAFLYGSTGKKRGQLSNEIGPEDFLSRRKGLVVADASNLFDASFKRDDLLECGCNAHGRRGFIKALDGGDNRAALVVGAYRRLYEFEREGRGLSNDERENLRQKKSKPVFDAILKWCQAYKPFEPPSSPLGEAIRYFTNHHEALGRFLGDGAIPIDNSLVERQHVRVALTRKNFLFAGSHEGGHRAAVVYTVLGCCALNDVDPVEYLADVLPRLGRRGVTLAQARRLLPHRWKAGRSKN